MDRATWIELRNCCCSFKDRDCTVLVVLHLFHLGGWLQRNATGIKADALANHREASAKRVFRARLTAREHDEAGGILRPFTDRNQHAGAHALQLCGGDDRGAQTYSACAIARLFGNAEWRHLVCRIVGPASRTHHAARNDFRTASTFVCGGKISATWHDDFEHRKRGRLRFNHALSTDTFMEGAVNHAAHNEVDGDHRSITLLCSVRREARAERCATLGTECR